MKLSSNHKERRYTEPEFYSLSVKDLLEAREAFHLYLCSLRDVVGTAIGLYRIRKKDPDAVDPDKKAPRKGASAKTLANSVIRKWSWPCILVFVRKWQTIEDLKDEPDQVIPRFLHMQDGRAIPVCVVEATKREVAPSPLQDFTLPNQLMGGGYPIFSDVQGQQHVGSLGCLVTDGDRIYGLTSKHVVGERDVSEPGREIFSFISGKSEKQKIGVSYHKQVGKKLLKEVFKGWPGSHSYSVIDAGLIELEDVTNWTAQVYGVGEIGEPVELNTGNISLNLIGCPVRAFGGASGEMEGEIQALFYRYKAIGGFDYVGDLLIGPRVNAPARTMTRPGDSGTLWFLDEEPSKEEARGKKEKRIRTLRPIALQWGGQELATGQDETELRTESFALATCLSTICRELDVDIIRSWNIGHSEYWGKLGHYKIAAKACELISNKKLKTLMLANLENIAFGDTSLTDREFKRIDKKQFVPLADVPDLAWGLWKRDGPNHYADMDQEGEGKYKDKTLLKLTEHPSNVRPKVWTEFYDSIRIDKTKRGALPFRIWQIYKEMVKSLGQKDVAKFVCAAGIVAHYIADACEPLHISQYHDGTTPEEKGVHSKYETDMLERFVADIIAGVNEYVKNLKASAGTKYHVKGGHAAAVSAVGLMRNTFEKLPPLKVIEAYNKASHRARGMFDYLVNAEKLGERTVACMGEGCQRLASLWDSAWKEGNAKAIPDVNLVRIERQSLKDIYEDREFLKAYRLEDPEFVEYLGE